MRGAAAWEALQEAMTHDKPLCLDEDRFTSDEVSAGDEIEMTELCSMCPVRAACDLFARESRSPGWWAGRRRK